MRLKSLNDTLVGIDNKALPGEPVTLRKIYVDSLVMQATGDDKMPGDQKFKMGLLAHQIATAPDDTIEVKVEDVALLKDRVGMVFTPAVVFWAWSRLEAAQ